MQLDPPSPGFRILRESGLADAPFTWHEALRAGMSRHLLDRLVKEGVLRIPLRGAYLSTAVPDTLDNRARCLAKVAGRHVVVVDRTAAWIWGVDSFHLNDQSGAVPIDAFSLRGRPRVRRGGVHGGTRTLVRQDFVRVEEVHVTSPVRTALDLACGLSRYEAVAVLDALMRVQGLTRQDLLLQLPRFRGRRGVIQAREVVQLVDPRAESQGESFTRVVIIDEGFPTPDLQVWAYDEHGNPVYRLDHAYEELKIAVEYDGEEHHTSDDDRRHDEERRAWLRANGWIIIVVTKRDLAVHSRIAWIETLREARQERLTELRARRARPVHRADRVTKEQIPSR